MKYFNVALRLNQDSYEKLDAFAMRNRWSKARAAEIIIEAFLNGQQLKQPAVSTPTPLFLPPKEAGS